MLRVKHESGKSFLEENFFNFESNVAAPVFSFFFFLLSFLVLFFVVELFRKEEFEISANC